MPHIIGVKFRNGGKSYFFTPGAHQVRQGDHVVVETSRGVEYGRVSYDLGEVELENSEMQIREILRKATKEDDSRALENRKKEKEAFLIGKEKITSRELEMKLIDVEYTFDNSKILFYFTADGRIDFRELVKDLAGVFRTRIELRQIGVRDETKMLGGMGICGRPLCCHAYLTDFIPVSIKMAKEQGLSLNPGKISGVCGRLMCCLKNEEDVYEEINTRMPGTGDLVVMKDGATGEVASVNILRESVRVLIEKGDEKEVTEVAVSDLLEVHHRKRKGGKNNGKENRDSDEEGMPKNNRAEAVSAVRTEEDEQTSADRTAPREQYPKKHKKRFDKPHGGRDRAAVDHNGSEYTNRNLSEKKEGPGRDAAKSAKNRRKKPYPRSERRGTDGGHHS